MKCQRCQQRDALYGCVSDVSCAACLTDTKRAAINHGPFADQGDPLWEGA